MIEIKKPVIRSPKSNNNKLSPSLKSKLKSKMNDDNKSYKIKTKTNFKKIKLTPKSTSKKVQSNLFIPTDLSVINKPDEVKPTEVKQIADIVKPVEEVKPVEPIEVKPVEEVKQIEDIVKPVEEVKPVESVEVKQIADIVKPNIMRKSRKKRRLTNRKKSSKNKTISIDLNNNSKKEKDIIELINKFEKMDIKEIKTFLKNKGIDSKKNNKSKLLPYLYLLTCVDDDINIIKS
jgi:hypothetical protein